MGTPTDSARANESQALLNWGFRFYQTKKLFGAQQSLKKVRVWLGQKKYVTMGFTKPLYVTIPVGQYKALRASLNMQQSITAPITQGQNVGKVVIKLHNKVIATEPVVALSNDPEGGFWSRLTDHIAMFFDNLFS
jgi:serine-type D-Ala-D-Ala carboxypeptidase (penicillin-binding protein 5/6)